MTFNSNGDTSDIGARYGSTLTLPIPTRTGYTFCGWFMDASFNTEIGLSNVSRSSSSANNEYGVCWYIVSGVVPNWGADGTVKNLYAKWGANTNTPYKVEHYKQNLNGTYPTMPTATTQHTGTTETIVSVYYSLQTYEGFYFDNSIAQTVYEGAVSADGTLALKAYYTRNTYTVTFQANGGILTDSEQQTVIYGGALSEPTIPERDDYDFLGWYTEISTANKFSFSTPITGTMKIGRASCRERV